MSTLVYTNDGLIELPECCPKCGKPFAVNDSVISENREPFHHKECPE